MLTRSVRSSRPTRSQAAANVAGRLTQREAADLVDQTGSFGQRDEVAGGHQPTRRVMPPHECFSADDGEIVDGELGLEVDVELPVADRGLELTFELDTGERVVVHRRVEHDLTVASTMLRRVERTVSPDHQLGELVAVAPRSRRRCSGSA